MTKARVIARLCKAVCDFATQEGLFPEQPADGFSLREEVTGFSFSEEILKAVEQRLTGTLTMKARVRYTEDAWEGRPHEIQETDLTEVHLNYNTGSDTPQTAFESGFKASGFTVPTKWIAEMEIFPTISNKD